MVRLDASEYVAEETEVPEVAEYSEEYSDEYSEECSDPLRYVLSETLLSRVPVLPLLPVLSVSESVLLLPPLSVLWLSKKRDIVGDMAGSGLTARCRALPPPRALGGILTSTRRRSVLDVLARTVCVASSTNCNWMITNSPAVRRPPSAPSLSSLDLPARLRLESIISLDSA